MKKYNYLINKNINNLAFDICSQIATDSTPPVFMCIGDSHFVADSLGAMVGQLLSEKHNIPAFVYGNLKHNIIKNNMSSYYDFIKSNHSDSKIFVIDSAMSNFDNLGTISIKKGGALIGALNDRPILMGDYNILASVATTGINSLMFLKSQKLKNVFEMAKFIASSIDLSLKLKNKLNA